MDDHSLRKLGLLSSDPTMFYDEEMEDALEEGEVPHFVIRKKNRHRVQRGDASEKTRRLRNLEELFQ